MKNLFLYFFCFLAISLSQASFDFSYELKYGDGTGVTNEGNTIYDLKFNENFLKINSSYNDFYLYLELEYSDPPVLGYSRQEIKDVLSKFYLEKQFDNGYVKVGNIYTLYGAGLGLYTFPDQNIDFDNNIEGFEVNLYMGNIEFFAVAGTSNLEQRTNPAILEPNRFSDNFLNIAGFNYDFLRGYGHLLHKRQKTYMDNSTLQTFVIDEGNRSTLLDWDFSERLAQMIAESGLPESDFWASLEGDTLNTESIGLGYGIYTDFGDIYFEGEWSDYDKILGEKVDGHRYYLSFGTTVSDIGFSYEYKDYDMPYDILTFTAPPTGAIESSSILAARNSHSMNYGDETGHQFEIVKSLWGEMSFLGNLSMSHRHKAKNKTYTFSSAGVINYIEDNPFSGASGEEGEYLSNLLDECDALIQDQDNMTLSESELPSLSFSDFASFDEDEGFISFYPYRQIYGEISGYINENTYLKVGYDMYNEVLKHKEQEIFDYPEVELQDAFSSFYDNAEEVVDSRWQEYFDACQGTIDFFGYCVDTDGDYLPDSMDDAAEYANQEFSNQFGMSREEYLSSLSFNEEDLPSSSNLYRQIIESWTIPTQLTYNIGGGKSLNFYLEYQNKHIMEQQPTEYDVNDIYFSGSYTHNGFWTVTLFYEKENKLYSNQTISNSWEGVDLSFDLEQRGQLSIFYGSQKGGRVCANGICADQPGFEDGLKVTYRTFF